MASPRPPFDLAVRLPSLLHGADVRVRLVGAEPASVDAAEEMVTLFAAALRRGLFTPPRNEEAGATVPEWRRSPDGRVSQASSRVTVSDPTCFVVLVALLAQVHHAGGLLAAVEIASDGAAAGGSADDLLESRYAMRTLSVPEYPARIVRMVNRDHPSWLRAVFHRPLSRGEYASVAAALDIWGHITHLGGYVLDFDEQTDFTPAFGTTSHLLPDRIEHLWPAFDGWRGAFQPLVNLAHAWHRSGLQLREMTIN